MKKNLSNPSLAILALACALSATLPAMAQVAGSTTTVDIAVVESTQAAMGWSVKKSLMGKTLYNDSGQKVGKVDDLIISPDRSVSYVIVSAGGFIGIGRHDVAIPVRQVREEAGRLVMAGATKDSVKAMPAFNYAADTTRRDRFVAAADKDIAQGRAALSDLEKKAGAAAADAKVRIDAQRTTLQADVKAADAKLAEMKQATAARWKEFEAGVSAATANVRKSIAAAVG